MTQAGGDILTLARKLERAMRNRTGFSITLDELDAMIEEDAVDGIYAAKLRRLKALCPAKQAPTSSAITGSTSAGTGSRRMSGRSPDTRKPLDLSSIAALGSRT